MSYTPLGPRETGRGRSGRLPHSPERPFASLLGAVAPAAALLLLAVACRQVLADGPLLGPDRDLAAELRTADAAARGLYQLLADLGDMAVALPVFAVAAGWVLVRARSCWWPVCCTVPALACVPAVVSGLKAWTGRGGPLGGEGYFPSGHAATAAVAFGCAALLLAEHAGRGGARAARPAAWSLWAAAAALTAANGLGLVVRGYHWPLDVAASWCLAVVLTAAASAAARRGPPRPGRRRRVAPDHG